MLRRAAFHKRTGRIINLLTVQEILDEEHVQKMLGAKVVKVGWKDVVGVIALITAILLVVVSRAQGGRRRRRRRSSHKFQRRSPTRTRW